MSYIICKSGPGPCYVAKSGRPSSYVLSPVHARQFKTREAAKRECCGNETVVLFNLDEYARHS